MRQRHECLVEHWRDIRRIHPTGANVRFIARRFGRAPAPSTATGIPKSLEPENGDVAGDVPSYPGSPRSLWRSSLQPGSRCCFVDEP